MGIGWRNRKVWRGAAFYGAMDTLLFVGGYVYAEGGLLGVILIATGIFAMNTLSCVFWIDAQSSDIEARSGGR